MVPVSTGEEAVFLDLLKAKPAGRVAAQLPDQILKLCAELKPLLIRELQAHLNTIILNT